MPALQYSAACENQDRCCIIAKLPGHPFEDSKRAPAFTAEPWDSQIRFSFTFQYHCRHWHYCSYLSFNPQSICDHIDQRSTRVRLQPNHLSLHCIRWQRPEATLPAICNYIHLCLLVKYTSNQGTHGITAQLPLHSNHYHSHCSNTAVDSGKAMGFPKKY